MTTTAIAPGDIVAGLEPDEHVEVSKVTAFGTKSLVEGVGVTSRRVIRRPLGADELARLVKIRGSSFTYDGNARAFLLGVEAHRIKTAYQFDPLFAVNSSAVDVLPHQVEAVYRYLLPLPRIRFLLADDTGAGKTIMAGLILKELLFRGTVNKVLIIVPGGLTRQWVDEMAEKFGLNFRLINRVSFEAEEAISKARNRFFLRRLKEEMVDWDSQPLFRPRFTKTVGYELTPEELDLYTAVTQYVRSRRKEAKAKKNRNVELTLMVMQRRLASSIYAITCTLRNRRAALDEVLRILRDPTRSQAEKKRLLKGDTEDIPKDYTDYEDLDEAQRDAIEKKVFGQVLSDNPEEVEKERAEVGELLRMAEALNKAQHKEAKFAELLKVLDSSDVIRRENEKLVIFTEHKDTMDNLTQRLTQRGYTVTNIHGAMDVDARK